MQNSKNILWLPTGGQIGDALMALSVFAEFFEKEPRGSVTYLVRRNSSVISDLAAAYPRVHIVPISKNSFVASIQVVRLFLSGRYIVFVPPTPGIQPQAIRAVSVLFGSLPGTTVVGVPDRTGWKPPVAIAYDASIPYIDNLRRMIRVDGIKTARENTPPLLRLNSIFPKKFSLQPHKYIAIHPFPTLPSKTLPMRRWRTLLAELAQKYPDLSLVITGSKENEAAAKEMADGLPRVITAIDMPILEVAGIIQNSALYIGVDTGITHLAGVLQHKSVVLGQRSSPTWLPYYNPNAVILLNTTRCTCDEEDANCFVEEEGRQYYKCLYDITDDAIAKVIANFLP